MEALVLAMVEDAQTAMLLVDTTSPSLQTYYPMVTASNKIDIRKTRGKRLKDARRKLPQTIRPFGPKWLCCNVLCTVRSKPREGKKENLELSDNELKNNADNAMWHKVVASAL